MAWHRTPTDYGWRRVTLASTEALGYRLWLFCGNCQRDVRVPVKDLADRHGLDPRTPLHTISKALRCTRCGERKAQCAPEPYRLEH